MKKVFILLLLVLSLVTFSACSSNSYIRDDAKGSITTINLEDLNKKIKKKESFMVQITMTNCPYCKILERLETQYIKNHNVSIFNLAIDNEKNPDFALKELQSIFLNLRSTPSVYWFVEGEVYDKLNIVDEDKQIDELDKWVVKYQIDKKNK